MWPPAHHAPPPPLTPQRAIARLQRAAEAAPEVGASLELGAAQIGDKLEDATQAILVGSRSVTSSTRVYRGPPP